MLFKPVVLFISLRYIRAKRSNRFISFISFTSMLGIALGIMTLITVMSVMNGFDREIKSQVFSVVSPLTITDNYSPMLNNWVHVAQQLQQDSVILNVAPFINGQALLMVNGEVAPILLNGVLPSAESKLGSWVNHLEAGSVHDLHAGDFRVIVGKLLAERLNLQLGNKITVLVPEMSITPAGMIPQFKRFIVSGIFNVGSGFGFDNSMAFVHLHDAQQLYGLGKGVSGVHVHIQDAFAAPRIGMNLQRKFPQYNVADWSQQFGAYFHAVKLEKTMMFAILSLIIAVAAFNLVSTLVMVVNDKASDIAILRTLGANPRMIMSLFIMQGAIIGAIGVVLGIVSGLFLTWHITDLVNWLNATFHLSLLSANVYFVDYLPVELLWSDVGKITAIAFGLSILATIYPAWRASRVPPVEALRYE